MCLLFTTYIATTVIQATTCFTGIITNSWILPFFTLASPIVYSQFSNQSDLSKCKSECKSFLSSQPSNGLSFYSESSQNLENSLLGPTEFKPSSLTLSFFDLISYNSPFHWYIPTKHNNSLLSLKHPWHVPTSGPLHMKFPLQDVLSPHICTTCTFTPFTSLTKGTSLIPFLHI